MTDTATAAPIMVRARLTDAEWLELRSIGLRTKTPVADLVAAALRVSYPLAPKEDSSAADNAPRLLVPFHTPASPKEDSPV